MLYFGVYLPLATIHEKKKSSSAVPANLPDRLKNFQLRTLMLILMATISAAAAYVSRIPLLPRSAPPALAVLAGVGVYAAMVLFMRPRWRRAARNSPGIVYFFTPTTPAEYRWWCAVSVMAGIGEELTWRGVQVALLMPLVGSYWMAASLSAAMFALAHCNQGWRGVPIFFAIAMAFQLLVWLAGSLVVAMAVHVAYDLTVGVAYGRLERERLEKAVAA